MTNTDIKAEVTESLTKYSKKPIFKNASVSQTRT